MEGLGQALQLVAEQAKATVRTAVIGNVQEPTGYYYLIGPDGKAELKLGTPTWHSEKLANPDEMKSFVKERHSLNSSGIVFYDNAGITFVFDREDRRHRATCQLRISPQYAWLLHSESAGRRMTQSDFIRELRISFRGCLGDGNLLALLRQLKFANSADAAAAIQHGRESIGKQILLSVTGESAIPEEMALNIPVFDNFDRRTRVMCAIEIFPQEQQFRLTPYPQELKRAMDETIESIAFLFEGDDMPPAFRGEA